MANTSALITKLEGQAWVRNTDGSLQPLRVGMRIPVNAEIITAAGSQLSLQGNESGVLQVAQSQQLKLADDLFKAADPQEAAIANSANADVNALVTALNQGQDPLAELEPAAATLVGGEGAGSTYVRLASVIERTSPLALQYPRSIGSASEDFISGGVAAQDDAAQDPQTPAPEASVGSDAQTVDEAGLGREASTETTRGNISVSASDGINSVTIGGQVFTVEQLLGDVGVLPAVDTGEGTLQIIGYTPGANNQTGTVSYEYTLNAEQMHPAGDGNNTLQDPIEVTVTGNSGSTAIGSIVITIVDDVPIANDDTDLVDNATAKAAGNVITGANTTTGAAGADVQGADGASVTNATGHGATTINAGVVTVVGQHGTLVMQANGQYVYTRTGSGPLNATDVFNYTLTDGDGDPETAKLTITIKDGAPTVDGIPTAGSSGAVVYEAGLPARPGEPAGSDATANTEETSGSFTFSSADGVQSVTLGGITLGTVANPAAQTVTLNGVSGLLSAWYALNDDGNGGTVHYKFTLTDNTIGDATAISLSVVVTDTDGDDSPASTLVINVVDDAPTAKDDTDLVDNATAKAAGNVITGANTTTGAAGADVQGADGASVTNATGHGATTINAGVVTVVGQHGTLVMQANGQYVYTRTGSGPLDATDVFNYTLTDGDGDPETAKLTITIKDGAPTVNDIEHSVLESSRTETKSNVVLTIDLSGSMNDSSGVAGKTRLDLVKEAVSELLNSGSVNAVFITTFSSSGYATNNSALNGGQWYTTAQLQQAILAVNALTANGGTNYDGALTSVMNYVNAAGTFPAGAGKNVSVFMSDGEPVNGAVGTVKETAWITWLGSKNFSDAYAIGFGGLTATNANNLEPIAWKAGEVQGTNTTAAQDDHVILSDVTALKDALLQTVLSPGAEVTGNLKTEGGNTAGDGWGGAVVHEVTFGTESHTFNSAADTFTFDLGAVGKVVVKGDGTYTFTANNTTDVNAALSAALTYTLKDVDGSVSNPASLVFTLTDRSEVSSVDDGASVSTTSTMVPVTVPNTSQANFNTNDTGDWSYSTAAQVSFTNLAVAAGGADAWLRSSNTAVSQSTGSDGRLTVTDNNGSSAGAGEVFTPIYTASSAGGEKLSFQVEARGNWSNGNDTAQWVLYQKVGATWVALTGAGTSGFITSNSQPVETKALDAAGEYRIYLNVTDGSGGGSSSNSKASVSVDDFQVIHPVTYVPQWSTSSVSGNVLNNDSQGSEGASLYVGSTKVGVAGVDVVGTYGTLHLNADGSYTYTTASGAPYHATQQDVFEYHLTQADGDTATANLTITVNASGPGVLTGVVTETPVVPAPLPGHEILASTGLDTLVGTSSDDLFTWKSGTQSALVDVVKGFGTAGSDKLVLGDLLQGEEHTSDLSKFLHLETQAGTGGTVNTVIKVSTSGGLAADGSSGYNQQIVVEGVDLTGASHDQNTMIKELIDQGKLKLDHG